MGVFQNNLMGAAAAAASAGGGDFYDYQIANSCRFDGSSSYLVKTWGSAPSSTTQKTISVWIKRSLVGNSTAQRIITAIGNTGSYYLSGSGVDSDTDSLAYFSGSGGRNGYTDRKFRDPSAWFHFVAIYNSAESNDYDRIKIYVNGELIPLNGGDWTLTNGYPTTTVPDLGKNGVTNYISRYGTATGYFNGYMADFIQIDGSAAISDFGETKNGVWVPKDPSGLTFGNNGFWLKFESASDLGNDSSGNNNDWTANNFSAHDQMLDSPTFNSDSNGGNFATYNPLNAGSYATLSEGNLKALGNTSSDIAMPSGTFAMTSGKWYFERLIANESSGYPYLGLAAIGNVAYNTNTGGDIWAMRFAPASGTVAANGTAANVAGFGTITATSTGLATATTGDIIGFHLDLDNRKCWLTKNGAFVNSGDPSAGTNPQWSWTATPNNPISFIDQIYNGTGSILNAGQDGTFAGNKTAQGNSDDTGYGNFYYAPDTGFLAMCSGNLPTADAVDPAQTDDDYPQKLFNPVLYTGSGSTQTITGAGFQPDFTWIKNRGATGDHCLMDSTRGAYGTNDYYYLRSPTSGAEEHTTDFHNFASDGFIVSGTGSYFNASGNTFVGWNWRANGGTTASNSDGDTSSVTQVDPSGGFSIVTYTGFAGASGSSTVGHGMSVAPNMIIHKSRSRASGWWCQFPNLLTNAGYFIDLAGNGAETNLNSYGTMNVPTTSVFTINGVDGVGGESATYVAYCFANIEGYCKVGSYIANSNADNAFVYTGFRPAFLMVKGIVSGAGWVLEDNKTSPFNPSPGVLEPNQSSATYTSANPNADFLSNGFKVRTNNAVMGSTSYDPYVYLAFAENPFKYATAR